MIILENNLKKMCLISIDLNFLTFRQYNYKKPFDL